MEAKTKRRATVNTSKFKLGDYVRTARGVFLIRGVEYPFDGEPVAFLMGAEELDDFSAEMRELDASAEIAACGKDLTAVRRRARREGHER